MAVTIIHLETQHYLGMAKTYPSVETFDPEEVFFKLFIPNLDLFKKFSVDPNLYAFPVDNDDGTFTYLAACKVKQMGEIPDHLPDGSMLHVVPAGKYVQFDTTPHELGEIAEKKIAEWFAAHPEHIPDPAMRETEVYPPECTSTDALCWIQMLLKE